MFIGGPVGRWVIGTVLGLRKLGSDSATYPGQNVEEAGATLVLTVAFAILLAVFALVRVDLSSCHI